MSIITREQLRERAREKVKSLEFAVTQTAFADSRAELEEELELARIALASLEAEAVAWLWSHRKHPSEVTLVRPEDDERAEGAHWSGWSCQALYAEPPAPVSVPDALPENDDEEGNDIDYMEPFEIYALGRSAGWNACRAAMLQGAENAGSRCTIQTAPALDSLPKNPESRSGNSPVIPDGWIACSERMPEETGDIIVVSDGIVMSGISYSRKKGFYLQALEYDADEPVDDVTHWMPLPAAPRQEVKP